MSRWIQSLLLSNKMNDFICQTSNKTYPHVSTVKLDFSISCGTPDLDAHAEKMGNPVVVFHDVATDCGQQMALYVVNYLLLLQSTPVISRQLGAKIRERELSGSPVISHFRARATIRDLLDDRPTFSRWRLPNSMLSDNRGILLYLRFPGLYAHRHRISVKSQQATLNFNNHATKLSNCTLRKATYDAFRAEIIQTTSHFDRKQKCFRACATGFTKVV